MAVQLTTATCTASFTASISAVLLTRPTSSGATLSSVPSRTYPGNYVFLAKPVALRVAPSRAPPSVPAMNIEFLGSPNFTPGRDGHDLVTEPRYVVIHTMVGTIASANARFQQASEQASAHYGVGLDGRIVQWV